MAKVKTNRDVVNHGANGKGDASRVTDEQAYRRNFDEINWGPRKNLSIKDLIRRGREMSEKLMEEDDSWRMGL